MWVEYPFNTISLNDFLAGLSCSISSLVYCMRTENVVSVMCNGHWIMKDKKILLVNEVLGSYFSLVSLNIYEDWQTDDGSGNSIQIINWVLNFQSPSYKIKTWHCLSTCISFLFLVFKSPMVYSWMQKIVTLQEDVISKAQRAASELLKRAGIIIPNRMNVLWLFKLPCGSFISWQSSFADVCL